jgi:glucuronate isomerase
VENAAGFREWLSRLEAAAGTQIKSPDELLAALLKRHDYFHHAGCRMSDRSFLRLYDQEYTGKDIEGIFSKLLEAKELNELEIGKWKTWAMYEIALMDADKDWVQVFHMGPIRNVNSRMMKLLGPDSGFDSMGDSPVAVPLARFLDSLACRDKLPKTLICVLNPKDCMAIATMLGNFQDDSAQGKMQYGPAWWYLDQKDGIEAQLKLHFNMGTLGTFVGMVTDSRSFLSFSRHDYFRRILCNLMGSLMVNGEIPDDTALAGKIIQDICYHNAVNYFGIETD